MAAKTVIITAILIIALIALFLPGYTRLQDAIAENKRLEKRIAELTESIKDLTLEKARLETDITYIEKVARQKMGVVKEGEKIIEITK